MENNINAFCKICGSGYHVCNSCLEQKTFSPWRTVTDTIEHYKIYIVLHSYSITGDKEKAKLELQKCDLNGLDNFRPEIKSMINEIIQEPKKAKNISKKNENGNEIKHEDVDE